MTGRPDRVTLLWVVEPQDLGSSATDADAKRFAVLASAIRPDLDVEAWDGGYAPGVYHPGDVSPIAAGTEDARYADQVTEDVFAAVMAAWNTEAGETPNTGGTP